MLLVIPVLWLGACANDAVTPTPIPIPPPSGDVIPPPVIVSFTAVPAQLAMHEATALRAVTTNATTCTITPDVGDLPCNSFRWVTPPVTATTTYTLHATGPSGTTEAAVTVEVTIPDIQYVVQGVGYAWFHWYGPNGEPLAIWPYKWWLPWSQTIVHATPGQKIGVTVTGYTGCVTIQILRSMVPLAPPQSFCDGTPATIEGVF